MKPVMLAAILALGFPPRDFSADATEDVKAAIAKVADAANYSWNRELKGSKSSWTVDGKTDKEGLVWMLPSAASHLSEGIWKGEKWAVKTADGWKGPADAAPGQFNPTYLANGIKALKLPTIEAQEMLDGSKQLKSEGNGVYSSDLSDDQTKELFMPGSSKSANYSFENEKGSVKFWIKNGGLIKYEIKVSGKMFMKKVEVAVDRTITTTLKDVNSTKMGIPPEAKAKLN